MITKSSLVAFSPLSSERSPFKLFLNIHSLTDAHKILQSMFIIKKGSLAYCMTWIKYIIVIKYPNISACLLLSVISFFLESRLLNMGGVGIQQDSFLEAWDKQRFIEHYMIRWYINRKWALVPVVVITIPQHAVQHTYFFIFHRSD